MKKTIALLLTVVMCLSLCACGKSEAVKDAESLIAAIGEVTLDSEAAIIAAEEAYAALTAEEKEQVENYSVLIDAKAGIVKILIDEIGEVTLDSKTAIVAAEEAYAALTAEGKEQVENYSVLIDARKQLDIEHTKQLYLGSWYNPYGTWEVSETDYGTVWSIDENSSMIESIGSRQVTWTLEEYEGIVYLCYDGLRSYVRPEDAAVSEHTITTDNWQNYLTAEHEVYSYYDDFGDLTLYGMSIVLDMKDAYRARLLDVDSSVTFEFAGTSGYRLGYLNNEEQIIHFANQWEEVHDENYTQKWNFSEWQFFQYYTYPDTNRPHYEYARADHPDVVTVLNDIEYNRLYMTPDDPLVNRVAGTLLLYDNPLYFEIG